MELTRINNDINGNPRYVIHYLEISDNYKEAVTLANGIGGRKYHTKKFGGGIVFQSYNTDRLKEMITELKVNIL